MRALRKVANTSLSTEDVTGLSIFNFFIVFIELLYFGFYKCKAMMLPLVVWLKNAIARG